ncbi:hypothetical protein J5E65_05075, partial [Streptococcus pneumoniae]|nr:hypothetical protein [Streptococcus pneumoniae]
LIINGHLISGQIQWKIHCSRSRLLDCHHPHQPWYADPYRHFLILFENLFKPRQRRLAVYMLLTSSVLSATSKQCFEQPAASFLF